MWSIVLILFFLLLICISVLYVTNQRYQCYVREHGCLVRSYQKFEGGDASNNLFIRYGGLQTVQAVVDQAVTNLLAEETLAPVFAVIGKEGHRSGIQLKACLDLFFCRLLGFYTPYPSKTFTRGIIVDARSMKASHAHLSITQEQFLLFNSVLAKTLTDAGVSAADVSQLTPELNALMCDIVTIA